MTFTLLQKREAYKKLSDQVQSFIMDNETSAAISDYLVKSGLNEDQADLADTEILNAMYGLQTLNDTVIKISQITKKSEAELTPLKSNLENNIFNHLRETKEPKKVMDVVTTKRRVSEISKKYGLNSFQEERVINDVINSQGDSSERTLTSDELASNLNISKLLAEQIEQDLKTRVYESAQKQTEDNIPRIINKAPDVVSKIPEIRPVNLPMNQPANQTRETMVGNNFMPTPKPAFQNVALDSQKTTEPSAIGVPRYAEQKINPIVEKKLNTVTPPITPTTKESVVRYEKDPYREPLG